MDEEKCEIFQHKTIGEIQEPGEREGEIEEQAVEDSMLVKDPKYCVPTSKASLEGRDPSKSGGGYRF